MSKDNYTSAGITTSSRRSVLKRVATFGSLIGAGAFATNTSAMVTPKANNARFQFNRNNQAPYGNGGAMTFSISEFHPIAQPSTNNWSIPIEVTTNAVHRNCRGCGINDELDTFYNRFTYPNRSRLSVYSPRNNPDYTGASAAQLSPSNYNFEDYARVAVNYGLGKLFNLVPYGSELLGVGKMLARMVLNFINKNPQPANQKITTKFNWLGGTHQACSWVNYEVKSPANTDFYVDIVGKVNRHYINSIDMAARFNNYYMYTPTTNPQSLPTMTDTELQENDIAKIPMETGKQNPAKFGLTAQSIDQLSGDTIYIYTGNQSMKAEKKTSSALG